MPIVICGSRFLADETTGLIVMRPATGATEFVRAIEEEAYDWFELHASPPPASRYLRCRIYTDAMDSLRQFLERRGITMADRDFRDGVRALFRNDRLRRLKTANLNTSVNFVEEVAFVIHTHNVRQCLYNSACSMTVCSLRI